MALADNLYAPDDPSKMSDESVNSFLDRPQATAAAPTATPQPIAANLQPNFQRLLSGQQTVAPPTSSELYSAGQLPGQQGTPRQVTPWASTMAPAAQPARSQSFLGRLLNPPPAYVPPAPPMSVDPNAPAPNQAPAQPQQAPSSDPWYRLGQRMSGQ